MPERKDDESSFRLGAARGAHAVAAALAVGTAAAAAAGRGLARVGGRGCRFVRGDIAFAEPSRAVGGWDRGRVGMF